MIRSATIAAIAALGVGVVVLSALVSSWWLFLAVPLLALAALGTYDLLQRRHSVLRNYPILGHLRFLMEALRPEMQQYFIERNFDGRPYDRDTRSIVYQRAKGIEGEEPFGTERNVYSVGYESFVHSLCPVPEPRTLPVARIGGPDCTQPYDMALLNVSAMSFGALSANAILALNGGAKLGGFAHDTGEGGLSEHHLQPGGDLVWEIGTGYFGTRTPDGDFDEQQFKDKAAHSAVKCVSLKLSQGAKPGLGGVLPGPKVNAEIAKVRGVPQGETVVSPPYHRVFSTPRELVSFIARMRMLAKGKPTGFKLCIGSRTQFLAVCKAMLAEGVTPDFIIVDGSEGGTGAAPLEFLDHVGMPLTEGLITVHNALVGTGLRGKIKVGASGKVATGADIVKRMIQGADYTNA
ncbi:MAG: glutamate synthase-related protein, partial [Sciscionella sp.]